MSHKIGQAFDLSDYFTIFLLIFSLFMVIYLLRMNKKTNLKEYLFLGIVYIFMFLNMIPFFIRHRFEPSVFLWILNITFFNLVYFFALLYFMSIRNDSISKKILISAISFLVIQVILRLFTTLQLIPEKAKLFGILVYSRPDVTGLMASALKIGDIYIIADGMPLPDAYYRLIVIVYGLITYIKLQPALSNSKTKKAKNIWIVTVSFWLISPIGLLLGFHFNNHLFSSALFSLLGGVFSILLLGFIVFKYPYSLILTKEQLVRAKELYKIVNIKDNKNRTLKSLSNYIQELPPELIQLLESNNSSN